MNTRIQKLREELFADIPAICPERAVIFTEAMKKSEGGPISKRRAQAFYEVLDKMTIYIRENELIVGNQSSSLRGAPVFPEYSVQWIIDEFEGRPYHFAERPCDQFQYTEDTKTKVLETIEYWKDRCQIKNVWENLPENARTAWEINAIDDGWCAASGLGNLLPDHEMVLAHGLEYLIAKAEQRIQNIDLTEPGTINQYWFLQSVVTANKAVINFAERYAVMLKAEADKCSDAVRKNELLIMSENCRRIPAKPAETFWQAVQTIWFIQLILHIETNGHAISLGRFDQYLYPYYKNDIEKGIITNEQALELVESFFIKANEINKLRSWPDSEYFPGYHLAENLAIGGQLADGSDAVNGLTHVVLEATGDLKLTKPSVSLRWYEGTSDEFMHKALETVDRHKEGQPAMYNDPGVMKILEGMGVAKEDLYTWAPVGCIEASIPGKWDFAAKGSWLNVGKVFEMTLNNGTDPNTGICLLPGDGSLADFKSSSELMNAFKKQLHYYMEMQVIVEHVSDEMHILHNQNAFRSSLVHDCIERGRSLVDGGAIYTADGGPTAGSISVGNAFAAIEYSVFDKKIITAEQLSHALETNYEDAETSPSGEEIRQMLINKVPKFGNDDDYADKWIVEITDYLGRSYHKDFKSSRYGKGPIPATFALSMSSVTGNVAFGKSVGALPDGRKATLPVNNGVSPSNGTEKSGPTAVINSEGKLPSCWCQKGTIFNMRLTPESLKTPEGRNRALALVKSHFKNDQFHIQFNVLSDSTLKEAQNSPEQYQDLMVRISGYSAFFTPLNVELQQDVIDRMKFDFE